MKSTTVGRLLTGAFALALLIAVGLSANNSAQAQTTASDTVGAPSESFICSDKIGGCTLFARADAADATDPTTGAPVATSGSVSAGDNLFIVTAHGSDAIEVTIENLDLPRVTQKVPVGTDADADTVDGPDANPKKIYITGGSDVIIEAVHKSSGLVDARCDIDGVTPDDTNGANNAVYDATECGAGTATTTTAYQVKAFNGNKIQISYTPSGGTFASIKTVTVDNGKPTLVSTSPTPGLIVKGNTDVTFSADITDGGSGYAAKFTGTSGLGTALSTGMLLNDGTGAGFSIDTANNVTMEGGVRLVVAGNVVNLVEGDFEKIDGGWRVSKTLNSTALQAISTNVPWYFETRDRANNVQRTSGSVSGTVGDGSIDGTINDARWSGNLSSGTFLGTMVRVSRKLAGNTITSNAQPVTFTESSDTITVTNTLGADGALGGTAGDADDLLFNDAVATRTIDLNAPTTADPADDTTKPSTADYQCRFDDRDDAPVTLPSGATPGSLGTVVVNGEPDGAGPDGEGGTVDAATAAAGQLAVCQPTKGDKYEILGTNLITIDSVAPTLASGNPVVTGRGYDSINKDKADRKSIRVSFVDIGKTGSTATGSGINSDTVTRGAFSVSGHTVAGVQAVGNTVYLALADELGSTEKPTVDIAGGLIMDNAGNAVGAARQKAVDMLGPKLTAVPDEPLSNDKVTVTITSDEQVSFPTVYVTKAAANGDAPKGDTGVSPVNQTGALSYSYAHDRDTQDDGLYSVYVEAVDVSENTGKAGNAKSASQSSSITFQLDRTFNGTGVVDGTGDKAMTRDGKPVVTVSNAKEVQAATTAPKVEAISPMIITVDYAGEAKEYARDSYNKVTLTEATLKVSFKDGSSDPARTFDLATEVSSPDNIKYTIPLLNPKLGTYTLTVKGEDQAGNTSPSAGHSITWEVVAASPVDIDLQPGWNLISLPFQPANPAINSVIPADHPIGLVMTFDSAEGVWLFSRRDAESGLFAGDVATITATSGYFVNTDSFVPLKLLRPPLATSAAAPAQPPAIQVTKGWNLVPVSTNDTNVEGIDAATYFGTLGATWLQALAWSPLERAWIAIDPRGKDTTVDPNPIPGRTPAVAADADATPPIEAAPAGGPVSDQDRCGRTHTNNAIATSSDDRAMTVGAQVCVGEGLWLWVTEDGTLIPRG